MSSVSGLYNGRIGELVRASSEVDRPRMRVCFDPEREIPLLQKWFRQNNHPTRSQAEEFTEVLNRLQYRVSKRRLEPANIIYWFKNTRAAIRRSQNKNKLFRLDFDNILRHQQQFSLERVVGRNHPNFGANVDKKDVDKYPFDDKQGLEGIDLGIIRDTVIHSKYSTRTEEYTKIEEGINLTLSSVNLENESGKIEPQETCNEMNDVTDEMNKKGDVLVERNLGNLADERLDDQPLRNEVRCTTPGDNEPSGDQCSGQVDVQSPTMKNGQADRDISGCFQFDSEKDSHGQLDILQDNDHLIKEDELVFGEDSLGSLYSDRQGSNKPRLRICFDPEKEIPLLQKWFHENHHPSRNQVEGYVRILNSIESRKGKRRLDANNIIYWFKNTRAAVKRAQTSTACLRSPNLNLGLPSSLPSLHAHSLHLGLPIPPPILPSAAAQCLTLTPPGSPSLLEHANHAASSQILNNINFSRFSRLSSRENFDSDKLNSLQEDSFKERKNSDFFKYGNKEAYFKDWKSEDFLKDRKVEDFFKEKNNNDQLCHSPHSYCTDQLCHSPHSYCTHHKCSSNKQKQSTSPFKPIYPEKSLDPRSPKAGTDRLDRSPKDGADRLDRSPRARAGRLDRSPRLDFSKLYQEYEDEDHPTNLSCNFKQQADKPRSEFRDRSPEAEYPRFSMKAAYQPSPPSLSISSPCRQQTSPTHPFYRTSTSSSSPWNSRGPLPSTAPSPRRPSEEYRRHSPFCSLTEEDDPRSRSPVAGMFSRFSTPETIPETTKSFQPPYPPQGLSSYLPGVPGLVPLVLPYPSLHHSVIYMSQFMNPLVQFSTQSEKKKRNRTFIDPVTEVPKLEEWFEENSHPSHTQVSRYTMYLNKLPYRHKFPRLEEKNIQFWFKNRRAKCKRLNNCL